MNDLLSREDIRRLENPILQLDCFKGDMMLILNRFGQNSQVQVSGVSLQVPDLPICLPDT